MLSNSVLNASIDVINKFGATISIKTTTNGYDTTTGKIQENITTTNNVKAVIENYIQDEIIGIVKQGDIKFVIANDNITILETSKINFNNVDYNVVSIEPVYVENTIVIYNVQARK